MRAMPAALVLALAMPPAMAQAPAAPGWEAQAAAWAPALTACLAGQGRAMVVEAWAEGAALTARLLLPEGGRQDCLVRSGAVLARAPAGPKRPGEGLRAFMRERRCVDAWRVVDATGREVGWLAYPGCG